MTTPFADLSFEAEGTHAGVPAGWTWTRSVSAFLFAPFATSLGVSRFESFTRGWGADSFVDTLSPTNTVPASFADAPPSPIESFERLWRLPATPPPDGSHPGNETSLLSWDRAESAIFAVDLEADSFESLWGNDDPIVVYDPSRFNAAAFVGSGSDDSFETHWKDNQDAIVAFDGGDLTVGTFAPGSVSAEGFESVRANELISVDPTSNIITCPGHAFSIGDKCGFVNAGDGSLPAGLNATATFFIVGTGIDEFQVSLVSGGSVAPIGDTGSGTNYVHSDPSLYWTLTDVGV